MELPRRSIVLVGFMGAGKTTVAKKLATLTGFEVIDVDAAIAKDAGKSITRIFEQDGEEKFRELETAMLQELSTPGSARGPRAVSGGPPETEGVAYTKRNLPHFERPWSKYAITFSTAERRPLSPIARQIVLDCILHWNGNRYELFAVCVMPDHVHLLLEPQIKETGTAGEPVFFSLTEILHTLKSFTAHQVNKSEQRCEPVWEKESFDRMIRSERDLQEKFQYIVRNPREGGVAEPGGEYPWVWWPDSGSDGGPAVARLQKTFSAGRRKQHAGRVRSPEEGRIIDVGGGAVVRNASLLHGLGTVVWLCGSEEELWKRVEVGNDRPLLKSEDARENFAQLFHQREVLYRAVADHILDVDEKAPDAIAAEIVGIIT